MTRLCMIFLLLATIVGLTASPATVQAGTLLTGLELYSSMDDATPGTPGTVPDNHNSYDGDLYGVTVAPFTDDPDRDAVLQFDGSDSQYADYGDILDPGTGSYTASLWFRTDDVENTQFIMSKGNDGSLALGWSMFLENGKVYTRACYDDRNPGGLDLRLGMGHAVTADEWHHLALVIDNTGGVLKGYLDGVGSGADGTDNDWDLGGGGQTATFVPGQTFDVTETLRLGRRTPAGLAFGGLMDDFAIWDRALTDAEIDDIVDGTPIPEPSTLVLLVAGLVGMLVYAVRRRGSA